MQNQYPQRVNRFKDLLTHFSLTHALGTALGLSMMAGGWFVLVQSVSVRPPYALQSELNAPQWDSRNAARLTKLWLALAAGGLIFPSYWVMKFAGERGQWVGSMRSLMWKGLMDYGEMLVKAPTEQEITGIDLTLPQSLELPRRRDIAGELASIDGHIGIVSKTRSGKTTLLIDAIAHSKQIGHRVILVDGKGDARLKEIPNITYLQCNDPENIDRVTSLLGMLKDFVLRELAERQDGKAGKPIALYVDEYNLIRDTLGDCNGLEGIKGKDLNEFFVKACKRVLLQGAAAQIYLRASSHTSRVEDWGWNTGVLDSLSFLALGRHGAFESMEDLIRYQITGDKAKQYQQALDTYRALDFGDEPLILTTIQPLEFCRPKQSSQQAIALPPIAPIPPHPPHPPTPPTDRNTQVQQLERVFLMDADAPHDAIEPVDERAQIIISKVIEKGCESQWIDARWVSQYCFRSGELKSISADEIRDIFQQLARAGYGVVAGEGKALKWRLRA